MYQILTAESGHFLANILIDITFLLEQVLQLAVLILKVVHFQFQTLYFGLIAFLLLPLVVFQYSADKGGKVSNMISSTQVCHTGTRLILSERIVMFLRKK